MKTEISGEVDDLENQRIVAPVACWRRSLLDLIQYHYSAACQILFINKANDSDSEELELTRTANLAPVSPQVSEEVSLSLEENSSTISSANDFVSEEVNLKVEDDITTGTTDEAKIKREHAVKIVKEKDLGSLTITFGGIRGIEEAFNTDSNTGISGDEQDICNRRNIDGATLPRTQAPTPGIFKLLLQSCRNTTFFLLLGCSGMSTGYGISQEGPGNGWFEGVVGFFALIVYVVVPSLRKYISAILETKSTSQVEVEVCRGGKLLSVSPSDVVSGDIVCLEEGSLVPAEGLFVSAGNSLVLNDGINLPTIDDNNPFMVYGATVVSGNGRMLVTCVGGKTALGELMEKVGSAPDQNRYLPTQLDNLSTTLQNVALSLSCLMTLVLILRQVFLKKDEYPGLQADQLKGRTTESEELMNVMRNFYMKSSGKIGSLAPYLPLLIVGLTEGVPFSVALANAYWTKTKLSGMVIAQSVLACFKMCYTTTICFGDGLINWNPVLEVVVSYNGADQHSLENVAGIDKYVHEAIKAISAPLLTPSSSCSLTEHQVQLQWAPKSNLGTDNENSLQNCTIVRNEMLINDEESTGVSIEESEDEGMCLHCNGPASPILANCSRYYDNMGRIKLIDEQKRYDLNEMIKNMQSKHLKTIAFAYKKVDVSTPEDNNNLILLRVLGVKFCAETMEAVKVLQKAGVEILQFSEDNVSMLPGVTPICGIGKPHDKLHKVKSLQNSGQFVAMIGARTNETPALKEANVGIAMGTCTSTMVKESCDIICIVSFSFLATIIQVGKCIYYSIQKCIQLEFTMNISLLATTTITTLFLGQSSFVIIQVLWVTIIVTLSGLTLLMEPPTEEVIEKPPVRHTGPLISKAMWRNIILQASYQTAVFVSLQMRWKALPGVNEKVMESMVFNSYFLCQVFNQINSREPEKKNVFRGILQTPWVLPIKKKTPWVLVAVGVSIILQVAFNEIAHIAAGNARLNWSQWGVCLLIGMVSWPIDLAGKCAVHVFKKIRMLVSDINWIH